MRTLLLAFFLLSLADIGLGAEVRVERVPEDGLQPQVVVDDQGRIHLVYLKGDPARSDVRYTSRSPGDPTWDPPVTINSQPGSAIALGTIRGAQLALGGSGSLHVVWNGPGDRDRPAPLFYTRSLDGGATFEPQRNLLGDTRALDGGASVAAGRNGEVHVVWHAAPADAAPMEGNRHVFLASSADNGRSFTSPRIVTPDAPGVCACCSVRAFLTPDGELITLYRAARTVDQRDLIALSSADGGRTFTPRTIGRWPIAACPMSSASVIADGDDHTRGAWESEGTVFTSRLDGEIEPVAVSGKGARHPALARNVDGEILVSWSIGTGWNRGGELGWALLDRGGRPVEPGGTRPGIPAWGASAAWAEGNAFVVIY